MKKGIYCVVALLLIAFLISFFPALFQQKENSVPEKELLVVWMQEGENDTAAWLKKAAAVYEKKTGQRVYLRYASEEERRMAGAEKPDVLIPSEEGMVLAYRGWALIVPDETKPVSTPVPAPSLFIRPTLPPAADLSTPVPLKKALGKVAVPEGFVLVVENGYGSKTPLNDLSSGKADGALLTPLQAQQIKGGYNVQARPEYFVPVKGRAVTEEGQAFLCFLRSDEMQHALTSRRMFSWNPDLLLYGSENQLLHQMEKCR